GEESRAAAAAAGARQSALSQHDRTSAAAHRGAPGEEPQPSDRGAAARSGEGVLVAAPAPQQAPTPHASRAAALRRLARGCHDHSLAPRGTANRGRAGGGRDSARSSRGGGSLILPSSGFA